MSTTQPATSRAYPLDWPDGWPRTVRHSDARYQTEFGKALRDLVNELRRFLATHVVVSSNVPTRNDGLPYANAGSRRYEDPGVAVYFAVNGEPMVIACDKWFHVKDNLRAVGLTVAAMRMIARTGATDLLRRAFSGFKALPLPAFEILAWWDVLGVDPMATSVADVDRAYRDLARTAHPDAGGTDDGFRRLKNARDRARTALTEMHPETQHPITIAR